MRSAKKEFSFYQNKREAEPDGDTALDLVLNHQIDDYKELLSRYPHLINVRDKQHGNVALHVAASRGDIALANYLVSRGADLNVRDIFGNGPLHYAIDKGKRAVAELLLNQGANPNLQDFRGNSPIHVACTNNDVDGVKLMVKFSADPDMPDLNDIKARDKTNSPLIRSIIDRRIHALHVGQQQEAQQTVQFMSLGVGLGVGLGVALAKYQQAMIEHQLNLRLESRGRKRGNYGSVATFKALDEGSSLQAGFPPQQLAPGTSSSQLLLLPGTSAPPTAGEPTPSGSPQRRFF